MKRFVRKSLDEEMVKVVDGEYALGHAQNLIFEIYSNVQLRVHLAC